MIRVATRCRTLRFRLHCTSRQGQALDRQLNYQCELYNAALEERGVAWKWERRSVTYFNQCVTLTGLAEVRPGMQATSGLASWLPKGHPASRQTSRAGTRRDRRAAATGIAAPGYSNPCSHQAERPSEMSVSRSRQRSNGVQRCAEVVTFEFEVIPGLKVYPEALARAEESCKPQSGIGADSTLAVNDLVDATRWDLDGHRQAVLSNSEWL